MTRRPNLLFVSPITPSTTGNGLAMRAGSFVEAFAADFDVYVLVVPIGGRSVDFPGDLAGLCADVRRVPISLASSAFGRICHHPLLYPVLGRFFPYPTEWKLITDAAIRSSLRAFGDVEFDHIHVFRLYLYPFARGYAGLGRNRHATLHIDLDEIESSTRLKLAAISDARQARRLRQEAQFFKHVEEAWLPACHGVSVCSPADRETLQSGLGLEHVSVLPNTVRIPDAEPGFEAHDPFTFLFLGNLDYLPNRDALRWFSVDVLPVLRPSAPRDFRVLIAGSGQPRALGRLSKIPEFDVVGYVSSVTEAYRRCDAVIVPLRAGGGTRIKILEALAAGKPVVSTPAGAAGLELQDGRELLAADGAGRFAEACVRLMEDGALRAALAIRGREKVMSSYSQDFLQAEIRKLAIPRQPRQRR